MPKLTEVAEFVGSVLRLDKNTPVKGYDPETDILGESNEQAQALANRTAWLKEKIEMILLEYAVSVNNKTGRITLDYEDVGAERKGLAAELMGTHESALDPHAQYLQKTDASLVRISMGNQPLGYLKLDEAGKIPADVADAFKTRYIVANTEAERLAIEKHDDLTIVAQLNGEGNEDDQLWYLNGGLDPSDADNWVMGQSAVLAGAASVFGRTGVIVAKNGDYNAGQITETEDRVFFTPIERRSLEGKQDQLVSTVNLRTLHGHDLLGPGDILLTYRDVDADKSGTADQVMADHLAALDPHPQYLTSADGEDLYVTLDKANKPDGYLQLGPDGKMPAQFADILKARYAIVNTDAERHALPKIDNLTIAMQLNGPTDDDDQLWYLNAGLDASVEANWIKGQTVSIVGVTSIFGRSGMVEAQADDYDADQITETLGRVFLTPAQKASIAQKQDKLVSGTNIKTLHGQSLLGTGDIPLTADDFNADKKGAGQSAVDTHEAKPDPHPQYIKVSGANLPNGAVMLDANGKIPTQFMEIFKSTYKVVADEAERLALPKISDLTICVQLDKDTIFYLNGGLDPADKGNWQQGQSATTSGVSLVFGRTGIVVAEAGDYNTEQITETGNKLFITPAEKTTYAGKEDKGAGAAAVTAHEGKADPHAQYLNQTRGDARYVQSTENNKANGFLKLDANNKIPTSYIDVIQARHLILTTDAQRLALPMIQNLTIVAQLNGPGEQDDRMYYLNGGLDPSVDSNWHMGSSPVIEGVSSFNGRTGPILPTSGDYDADKITETTTRKFVTPDEKAEWSGKAEKIHKHVASDITDFNDKVAAQIGADLKAGNGISINYDTEKKTTTITATGGGSGSGGSAFVTAEKIGSTANQVHTFNIAKQTKFDLDAFALKFESGKTNNTFVQESFAAANAPNYTLTGQLVFNNGLTLNTLYSYTPDVYGSLWSFTPTERGAALDLTTNGDKSIVPIMTSSSQGGYVLEASSNYDGSPIQYYAFDGNAVTSWASLNQPSTGAPQWLRVTLPKKVKVTRYAITNRSGGWINSPTSWALFGSNDGTTWTKLDERSDSDNSSGKVRQYNVTTPGEYLKYQISFYSVPATGVVIVGDISLLGDPNNKFVLQSGSKNYIVNASKTLEEITDNPLTADVILAKGNGSATITEAQLATLGADFKVVTNGIFPVDGVLTPDPQIALPKVLNTILNWGTINSSALGVTVANGGIGRIAITRDLAEYFVFENSAWKSIGTLTADKVGAEKLATQGMTAATLAAITPAQWVTLYATNDNQYDKIAVAYGLKMVNALTDTAKMTAHSFNYNEVGAWKKQTPAEVEIRWTNNTVSFKTIAAGDYKLAYQAPQ